MTIPFYSIPDVVRENCKCSKITLKMGQGIQKRFLNEEGIFSKSTNYYIPEQCLMQYDALRNIHGLLLFLVQGLF